MNKYTFSINDSPFPEPTLQGRPDPAPVVTVVADTLEEAQAEVESQNEGKVCLLISTQPV